MSVVAARALLVRARRELDGPGDVFLMARMVGWALAVRVLKHGVSLPQLVRLACWVGPVVPPSSKREEKVVTIARWACRVTRWSSGGNCLERGLIMYRYLAAAGASPTLVVGVAARSHPEDLLRGHAWVKVGNVALGESPESLAGFQPVLAFAADGGSVPV